MACTTNWCILLFLVILIIYLLLDRSYATEALTDLSQQSLDQAKSMLSTYPTQSGYTAQVDKKDSTQTTEAITPHGYTAGAELSTIDAQPPAKAAKDDMSRPGPQANDAPVIDYYAKHMQDSTQQKDFNVADFLPKEINNDWFNTDLTKAQNEIDQLTLIEISRFCQGVDTVGQSMKNASRDIRGTVPNPKIVVGPWMNSSYDPDTNIKSWTT